MTTTGPSFGITAACRRLGKVGLRRRRRHRHRRRLLSQPQLSDAFNALPFADPSVKHPELGYFGDNDPIDVVEIGSASLEMGSVKPVKPLGVLAMIDDGELDWKVLAVASDDPLAEKYNDIDDVPEAVKAGVREWFRWYKTPDEKPTNEFGFDEKYLDKAEAEKVIEETNEAWKKLMSGETEAGKTLWTGK